MATLEQIRNTQLSGQEQYLKNQKEILQKNYQGAVQGFQGAYDRTKSTLDSEQQAFQQSLQNQYQMAQTEFNASKGDVQAKARETAQQAYIGKRMAEKAIPTQMARVGLQGTGMAESTITKNELGYREALNQNTMQMNNQLKAIDMELQKLAMKRDDQLTQAEIKYRNELNNAKATLEQNIATAGINRDTGILGAQGTYDLNASNINSTYQQNLFNKAQEDARARAQARAQTQARAQAEAQKQANANAPKQVDMAKVTKTVTSKLDSMILGKALTPQEIDKAIQIEVGKMSELSNVQKSALYNSLKAKYVKTTTSGGATRTSPVISQHQHLIY